jgi:hypothetical protein
VAAARARGRPPKFGRPSRVVAITLPVEVIRGLRRFHKDLGWAVVTLFEKRPPAGGERPQADAELIEIASRRSLIVVNRSVVRNLPGVNIIPLNGSRAFLALEPGRGMSDLELAVRDRLDDPAVRGAERLALASLRERLQRWRRDRRLRTYARSIIIVERVQRRPRHADTSGSGQPS